MKALELRQFLPFRLSLLSNRVSNGIAQTYQTRFALTVTQWRVMAIVGRHAGISAQEVVQRSAMDKVAVSRAVSALAERGVVHRAAHTEDRRRVALSLTDQGHHLYAEIIPAALRFENRLLEALSARERRQFDDLIGRLIERAEMLSQPNDDTKR